VEIQIDLCVDMQFCICDEKFCDEMNFFCSLIIPPLLVYFDSRGVTSIVSIYLGASDYFWNGAGAPILSACRSRVAAACGEHGGEGREDAEEPVSNEVVIKKL
jgi:hypothetical protein